MLLLVINQGRNQVQLTATPGVEGEEDLPKNSNKPDSTVVIVAFLRSPNKSTPSAGFHSKIVYYACAQIFLKFKMSTSSEPSSPELGSESRGSSVSTGLREEYEDLLRYAVVTPAFSGKLPPNPVHQPPRPQSPPAGATRGPVQAESK